MMKILLSFTITLIFVTLFTAASNAQTKLVGQIVCSECWFEADDRKANPYGTLDDIECAADCSKKGIKQSLAVEEKGEFKLYTLERGAFKMTGKDFLEFVPKVVEIEGDVRSEKGKSFIKVNALKVVRNEPILPTLISDDAVLALKDMAGSEQSLASLKGRVVVLNFWATWCEPCKAEMPDLSAIQNDYAALGVQVIGASGDGVMDAAKVLKFTRQYKVNFPVWLGASTDDMKRFGVGTVLPATVIIDKAGKIVWRAIGVIKPADLRKELDRLTAPDLAKIAKQKGTKKDNASLVPA